MPGDGSGGGVNQKKERERKRTNRTENRNRRRKRERKIIIILCADRGHTKAQPKMRLYRFNFGSEFWESVWQFGALITHGSRPPSKSPHKYALNGAHRQCRRPRHRRHCCRHRRRRRCLLCRRHRHHCQFQTTELIPMPGTQI